MSGGKGTEQKSKRVTITEVARHAGVSKTSVSRYLGGEIALLSEHARSRIEQAVAALAYRPSQMARGLKRGRTRLIGMIVADILNPYSVAVMHGVEAASRRHGFTLVVCNTGNDDALELRNLAALQSYSVEGLIVHTVGHNGPELQQAARRGLSLVLVDRKLPDFDVDMVGLDNLDSGTVATMHLIDAGYRDLLFVSEPLSEVSSRIEREAAFRLATNQRADCRAETLALDVNDAPTLQAALAQFLGRAGPGPKAILAGNGVVTLRVTQALRRLGRRLFADVGLLGFDELEWSELVGPGISTLAQPSYEIGVAAMDCLLRRLQGDGSPPRQTAFRGRLIARGSTRLGGPEAA